MTVEHEHALAVLAGERFWYSLAEVSTRRAYWLHLSIHAAPSVVPILLARLHAAGWPDCAPAREGMKLSLMLDISHIHPVIASRRVTKALGGEPCDMIPI